MDDERLFIDYYKILECDRNSSTEEIKKSYKRLLLCSHPDKVDNQEDETFLMIQKAWSVLKDPLTRKQYDATLSCHEHSELLLYDTIVLNEMECSEEGIYSYPCRCGGTYIIENSESVPSKVIIIECDECSFSIQVNKPS